MDIDQAPARNTETFPSVEAFTTGRNPRALEFLIGVAFHALLILCAVACDSNPTPHPSRNDVYQGKSDDAQVAGENNPDDPDRDDEATDPNFTGGSADASDSADGEPTVAVDPDASDATDDATEVAAQSPPQSPHDNGAAQECDGSRAPAPKSDHDDETIEDY